MSKDTNFYLKLNSQCFQDSNDYLLIEITSHHYLVCQTILKYLTLQEEIGPLELKSLQL